MTALSLPRVLSVPSTLRFDWAITLGVAVVMWVVWAANADIRQLTDLGLISIMSPLAFIALALVTGSFFRSLFDGRASAVLGTHLAVFITMVHATPAHLYGNLRYSWAWKHLGVIEYIQRTGELNREADFLDVYFNWPGFFAASGTLGELLGPDSLFTVATYAPWFFNAITAVALVGFLRRITRDETVVWSATFVFFCAAWVGQDYFSPQATGFFFHLVILTIALAVFDARWTRVHGGAALVLLLGLLCAALVTTHQLTPVLTMLSLVAVALTKKARLWGPAALLGVLMFVWIAYGASPYVGANLADLFADINSPVTNAGDTVQSTGAFSDGQRVVSLAGRLIILALGLAAATGFIRRYLRGHRDWAPLALLLAPALPVAINNFDGEMLFRVYLFAAPMLALFAVWAVIPEPGHRPNLPTTAASLSAVVLLLPLFFLAHFGKDDHYTFTDTEIEASTWVAVNAPPNTLLVEGSRNYPSQFLNYEKFRYVPISREDEEVHERIGADPVGELGRWLSDDRYAQAYLIITASQKAEAAAIGSLPPGFLDEVEDALRNDSDFTVAFETLDAVVFDYVGGTDD